MPRRGALTRPPFIFSMYKARKHSAAASGFPSSSRKISGRSLMMMRADSRGMPESPSEVAHDPQVDRNFFRSERSEQLLEAISK